MDTKQNYYRILHIQPDAPEAVIRASYRAQMQKLKAHPDLGGDQQHAAILNEAYATLSCSKKRTAYDQHLNKRLPAQSNVYYLADRRPQQRGQADVSTSEQHPGCKFCGAVNNNQDNNNCTSCNSPLKSCTSHYQKHNSSGRALRRQQHIAPVKCYAQYDSPVKIGIISNLSPLGLQLRLSQPLLNNQIMKLETDALTVVAKVKYCRKDLTDAIYVIGLEFITSHFKTRSGTFFSEEVY